MGSGGNGARVFLIGFRLVMSMRNHKIGSVDWGLKFGLGFRLKSA